MSGKKKWRYPLRKFFKNIFQTRTYRTYLFIPSNSQRIFLSFLKTTKTPIHFIKGYRKPRRHYSKFWSREGVTIFRHPERNGDDNSTGELKKRLTNTHKKKQIIYFFSDAEPF